MPDVPTTLAQSLADSDFTFWLGLFLGLLAPAKAPKEIVDKLNRELAAAVASPAVKEKLAAIGVERMPMTPTEFASYVKGEIARHAVFAKVAGLNGIDPVR
jgi:tripartite-type tricarboxylate transporter receptor subunit TctC